jgi:hypothetical protein
MFCQALGIGLRSRGSFQSRTSVSCISVTKLDFRAAIALSLVSDWTRQEGISRTEASTCPEGMVLTSSVRSMGDRLGCKDFSIVTDSPEERICQRSRCVWRGDR